jgi:hypothetical protein
MAGQDGKDHITVADGTLLIDGDQPIGIAVEGEAHPSPTEPG